MEHENQERKLASLEELPGILEEYLQTISPLETALESRIQFMSHLAHFDGRKDLSDKFEFQQKQLLEIKDNINKLKESLERKAKPSQQAIAYLFNGIGPGLEVRIPAIKELFAEQNKVIQSLLAEDEKSLKKTYWRDQIDEAMSRYKLPVGTFEV